mmetsp:Transcript_26789/g.70329  ORF Transcript_26789/g.70329 Transcript_26789/m.70329 type:complete len:333 (-) Transcript_26789:829-1827(-)
MGCAASQTSDVFTDAEITLIRNADIAGSVLSFIGSGVILLCYACFPDLRKFAFKLIFFISLSDIIVSVGGFLDPGDERNGNFNCGVCLTQAWLKSVFELSSVLWTACTCHCLYMVVVHHHADVRRFEFYYHVFSWGVPFVLALIVQFQNLYGFSGGWCWIIPSAPEWRFIQFYIPLWMVFVYNFMLYALLFDRIRDLMKHGTSDTGDSQGSKEVRHFWRLGAYPVVLLVCWSFGSVNRIQNSMDPRHPILWLFVAHRFFGSLQGLLNCLVYGMNRSVRARIFGACCSAASVVGLPGAAAVAVAGVAGESGDRAEGVSLTAARIDSQDDEDGP